MKLTTLATSNALRMPTSACDELSARAKLPCKWADVVPTLSAEADALAWAMRSIDAFKARSCWPVRGKGGIKLSVFSSPPSPWICLTSSSQCRALSQFSAIGVFVMLSTVTRSRLIERAIATSLIASAVHTY
jgi:hypothetical protein